MSDGIEQGEVSAYSMAWQKAALLPLDKASAALFECPGRCSAVKLMLNLAQMKNKHLSRCRLACLFIMLTTAALSHLQRI